MIGIVSINEQSLQETSSRVHIGLNSRDNLKYVALEYGQPIKHPDQDLYALIVIEVQPYKDAIYSLLTDTEKQQIQELDNTWFNAD